MPSVETEGFDQAIAAINAGPDLLREAIRQATKDSADTMVAAIRAGTPIHSGQLLAGWRERVEATATGSKATISNKVRYASFVERGAHPVRPMRAQPMLARGVALTTGTVRAIYDAAVTRVTTEIEAA